MISFNNSIIDVICLPFRGNYVTQDRDGHVARVHRGIDAQASIPTGKAKPALASQEPALTSRNGFPGGGGNTILFSLFHLCQCLPRLSASISLNSHPMPGGFVLREKHSGHIGVSSVKYLRTDLKRSCLTNTFPQSRQR